MKRTRQSTSVAKGKKRISQKSHDARRQGKILRGVSSEYVKQNFPAGDKAACIFQRFRPMIDVEMNVLDIIGLHPKAGDILAAYGLHCFQCAFNTMDSLESGARSHGLTDIDIENMVIDLQELIDALPAKPDNLSLTEVAAKALQQIGKQEKKKVVCLRVTTDSSGGFCMEFTEKPMSNDRSFTCAGIQGVSLIASPETLWRIGGSTVDFRNGKFKLDIEQNEDCECKGSCEKCEST